MIKFREKRKDKRKITKNIIVVYHNDCTDGFSAAWAAWKKFGNKADYIGVEPGASPRDDLKNKTIYLLDLIYPSEYLAKLMQNNQKIMAIDHHISNKNSFDIISEGLFDVDHSAAVLAWNHFHIGKKVPQLLKHVEDMDLWRFKVSKTKEIIAYLDLVEFSFKNWDRLSGEMEVSSKYAEFIKTGSLILQYQDRLVERIISNHAILVEFEGYKTYAVNSSVFNSQIANALYEKLPPMGIVWMQYEDGRVGVSLRSGGGVDVSKIAQKFGGGGHKTSAGFNLKDCNNLPWKKIKS